MALTNATGRNWIPISSDTNLIAGQKYIITGGGALVLTLPTIAPLYTEIQIQGRGSTSWKLAQNSGQSVTIGINTTTTGATGYVLSQQPNDGLIIICTTANTVWQSTNYQGFLQVN